MSRQPENGALPGWQLLVLLAGVFMAHFDFFVVNVAAPSIQHDLSASNGQLELIVSGYAFAYASGLVLGGRLGDVFGHRGAFGCGMLAFAASSTCCGLAAGPGELIGARLLQGAAAAVTLPQVLAIISGRTRDGGRARSMAWYGVAGGLGSLAGQVFGGFLVTADVDGLGWRLIFLINLPIGTLGALAAFRVLERPAGPGAGRRTLDLLGAGGLAAGVALLLVPLSLGHYEGWPSWAWTCIAVALPVLAGTVAWEWSQERRGKQPLLPVHLFGVASFRFGLLSAAAFMAMFASYMFALALLLQSGYGLDPFHSGLCLAPSGATFLVAALLIPRLPGRVGRHALVAGALVAAAALAGLALVARADTTYAGIAAIVPIAALVSLGNGAVLPSLLGMTLAQVPPDDAGAGAGALASAQQFAAAAGVAILGTVFFAASGDSVQAGAGQGMARVAGLGAALSLLVAAGGTALRRAGRTAATAEAVDAGICRDVTAEPAVASVSCRVIGSCRGSVVYQTIGFEQQDHVGVLTLQRPHKLNALNPLMQDELVDLGVALQRTTSLRCLLVRGAGPAFSSGLDLDEGLGDLLGDWSDIRADEKLIEKGLALASAFEWIPRLDVPSVAAVHGHAYGAGCQLALACDFRVFARSARAGLVESRYGLLPDMGATFRLPRLVGDAVARRLILLGEVVDGAEAAAIGLADQVVEDDDLDRAVEALVGRLVAQPHLAVRGARRAMAVARELSDREALRAAVTEQAVCLRSDDFRALVGPSGPRPSSAR